MNVSQIQKKLNGKEKQTNHQQVSATWAKKRGFLTHTHTCILIVIQKCLCFLVVYDANAVIIFYHNFCKKHGFLSLALKSWESTSMCECSLFLPELHAVACTSKHTSTWTHADKHAPTFLSFHPHSFIPACTDFPQRKSHQINSQL